MKRLHLLIAFAALAALLAFTAPAYAMSNGAPRLNCAQCHVGADQHPAEFVVEGLPKTVEPGKTYKIVIKITKGPESKGAAYGGFAIVATAGKFIIVDEKDTFKTTFTEGGKQYEGVTHTKEGSLKREWVVEWQAPSDCTGPIKFMISVLAANGDSSPMGDWYAHKEITVECAGAKPTPTVTTTTIVETVTTTTVVTSTSYTTITKEVRNPVLAGAVAVAIFVIVVAGYMLATRK